MVNALRQVPHFQEISVQLQSNQVLMHVPEGVELGAAHQAIAAAGYTPDSKVWLSAFGTWTDDSFLPEGWSEPISAPRPQEPAHQGPWDLLFEKTGEDWTLREVTPSQSVPQVVPNVP